MIVTWVAMWLSLAWLQRRARDSAESSVRTLTRGAAAALGSGLAFWAISGIWTGQQTAGYPLRLAYWTFAFLPGFVALLAAHRRQSDPGR